MEYQSYNREPLKDCNGYSHGPFKDYQLSFISWIYQRSESFKVMDFLSTLGVIIADLSRTIRDLKSWVFYTLISILTMTLIMTAKTSDIQQNMYNIQVKNKVMLAIYKSGKISTIITRILILNSLRVILTTFGHITVDLYQLFYRESFTDYPGYKDFRGFYSGCFKRIL